VLPLFRVRGIVTAADSKFTGVERLVALCLGDHMNGSVEAWPSLRRIAAWTGLGITAVRAALERLCGADDGIFVREQGGARRGERYAAARYRLREGIATRGTRETRGSSGEREGIASRAQGYRLATQKERQKERQNGPTEESLSPRDTLTANRDLDALADGVSRDVRMAVGGGRR
jgi:hypothetical protein